MFDQLGGAFQGQGVVDGNLLFNDKEFEIIMNAWAECAIGYNIKSNETNRYYQVHRRAVGQKLWEDMTLDERKKEFTKSLVMDLEITSRMIDKDAASLLLKRAYNPLDPMAVYYKCLLVKLGATISEDGQMKVPAGFSERLENLLHSKRVIDLIPTQAVDQSLKKADDQKLGLRLRLSL